MSGWTIFIIIALVLGVIISNLMLLKHSAKMPLPEHIRKAIEEKKAKGGKNKPTDC